MKYWKVCRCAVRIKVDQIFGCEPGQANLACADPRARFFNCCLLYFHHFNFPSLPGLFDNLPEYSGKIREIRKFDSTFFGISNVVVRCMDPMTRHILERTFEAVYDAGINPADLRGTNTYVYSGTSFSDYDLVWATDYKGGYGIMGRNRCMNANRVSYWLDINGTSVALDSNYANGILNVTNGWDAIKKGRTDIAIVSTANIQSCPEISIQINDLCVLNQDGKCKVFDNSGKYFFL